MRAGIQQFLTRYRELHPHVFCVVNCPENKRIDPLAGDGRGKGIHNANGRLDEHMDGNAPHGQTSSPLQLLQSPFQAPYIAGPAHLGSTMP